jgi:AraC-like DNA-binding protein
MRIVLAVVTLQALTTALLIYFNKRYKGEDLFLSLLFGVIFIHLSYKGAILLVFDSEEIFDRLHGSFSLLYGPMLFFYIQSVLGRTLTSRAFLLHTAPFLMGLGVNVLLTISLLIDVNLDLFMDMYHNFILYSLMFSSLGYGLYPFFAFSGEKKDQVLKLKSLIAKFIGAAYLFLFGLIIFGFLIEIFQLPINLGSRYTFYGLMLVLFFAVINVRMRLLSINQQESAGNTLSLEIHEREKYKTSRLETEEMRSILEALALYFAKKKPYLNPDFSLDDLAQELEVPRVNITQALNLELGQNFYQYLNTARVEESKKLLQQVGEDNLTVVGYESGFKSKSTFYKYFKDATGCSPSDYRKNWELSH